jgi:phage-related protein
MAVSQDDLLIKIDANTVEAVKSIKSLDDVFGGLGMQIIKANSAVQLAMTAFEGFKTVVNKLSEPFKDAIHASVEYNATLGKLKNTLKITGEYSEESVKSFEHFSHQMEMNTTLTQEQSYTMLALAKATGVGDKAAMQMVQTAKNLSAVTGGDVNDSFRALLSSLSSLKGSSRELIVLDPTLKNLSVSAFMSGAAIDQLSKKYDGFAESGAKAYKGIIAQAENFKDEIYRNVGDVLAVAFDMKGTAEFKRAMYLNVLQTIEEIKPALIEFAESIRTIKRDLVDLIVGPLKSFGSSIAGVSRALSLIDFKYIAYAAGIATFALSVFFMVFKAQAVDAALAPLIKLGSVLVGIAAQAWIAVAPMALLALKIAGITVAVLAFVAAVDFLKTNGINILIGSMEWLISKIELAMGKFLQFIGMMKEGAKFIGMSWKADDKSTAAFGDIKMGAGMAATIDKIKEMKNAYNGVGESANHAATEAKSIQGAFKDRKIVDPAAAEAYRTALEEIIKETEKLGIEANKNGMTQLEIIDLQLQAAERQIEAEKEKIRLSKQYTDDQKKSLIGALDGKKGAVRKKAESDKEQAPGQEYDAAIVAGKSMTNDITKAFQTGTMGMVTGMLGAVDAFVGAAQAVVDFIPGLLDKIANLFNSIADLPNKILSSFGKMLDSILNLITNFIPNIIKDVPKLVSSFIKFLVVGLPNAISGLIDSLPDLLTGFMDSIPEIVMTVVNGFLTSMPKIVVSLIQFIVFGIPKIIVGFVKAMPAIWKAFINGLVTGFKELGKIFGGTFKPKIEMPKFSGIGDDIKKLTGESSDIFNVKDLTSGILDSAKTQSDQFAQSIKDGMQWAIEQLVSAWRFIYDRIIMPIVNAFKAVFSWFTDGINNIFNGLGKIFSNIVDLIKPVFDLFVNAFKGAVDILKPIGDLFKQAVDTLQSVFSPFIDAINKLMGWSPSGGKGGGSGLISEGAKNVGDVFTGKKKIFSLGGPVYASTGMLMNPVGTDTIPAMLSPGEFVMSAGAVKNLGLDAMRNINAGKSPQSSAVYNNEFNIKIESKGNVDEAFIRNRLMSVIKDELRRSSLDGERLLSNGGVR